MAVELFTHTTYVKRISRLSDTMGAAGIDAVVVSPSSDLLYLCGYDALALERPTFFLVRQGKHPVLLVPRLEVQRVPQASTEVAEVLSWEETDDPYETAARILKGVRSVAVGDQMWAMHLVELQARLRAPDIRRASSILGPIRAKKEPEEIEVLHSAAAAADRVAEGLVDIVKEGMTEKEVATAISSALLDEGHDEVGFVIVGSGPNSASPHHEPTDRTITTGDVVVCDFGGVLNHYRSDITRTVVVGEAPPDFYKAYEVLLRAQELAVRSASCGKRGAEIDGVARSCIAGAGYGRFFIHRTGHGIGLDPHEAPYIAEGSNEVIEDAMCFSIEPGIYIQGAWGIRIEDIVVARDKGGERLNQVSRDPIYV